MLKYTKKGLRQNWSQRQAASRADRRASSAPLPLEIKNYEILLRRSLGSIKYPRVLILGATPELRDLAIKLGCQTLAIDISWDMLAKMADVMKYKTDPKNLSARADWFTLADIFKNFSFDAILADCSLNNVPAKSYSLVIKNILLLLKPGGAFITKHFVYMFERPKDGIESLQKKYSSGRLNWIWLVIHLGPYSLWHKQLYNQKTNSYIIGDGIKLLGGWLKSEKFKLTKTDLKKIENLKFHASNVNHIVMAENDWLKLIKKYFIVKARLTVKQYEWTEYGPVWYLKKK